MITRLTNLFAARDPGYLRLHAAARVTAAALTTVLVTTILLNTLSVQEVKGAAFFAMLVTFFCLQMVNDAQPRARRYSMALAVVPVAAVITLEASLTSRSNTITTGSQLENGTQSPREASR